MARPKDPDTEYRVRLHKPGRYCYAATLPYVENTRTGKKERRYLYWGVVNEDLIFTPNQHFRMASLEERQKLIFPPEWDISAAKSLDRAAMTAHRNPMLTPPPDEDFNEVIAAMPSPAGEGGAVSLLYGAGWLLFGIAWKEEVWTDLVETFQFDYGVVCDVLTLAMSPMLSPWNYCHTARWQQSWWAPSGRLLQPGDITRLTRRITNQHRMDFIRRRIAHGGKGALLACDSTTRSAWGKCLVDIRWGNNKDNPTLQNTVEAVVYSLSTHEPVYYRPFAGNENDMRMVRPILNDLEHVGCDIAQVVFDRGYQSTENIDDMVVRGLGFLMCAKAGCEPAVRYIGQITYNEYGMPGNMEWYEKEHVYCAQFDHPYTATDGTQAQLKVNVFLDMKDRVDELTAVEETIRSEQEELAQLQGQGWPESQTRELEDKLQYHKLLEPEQNGERRWVRREDKVRKSHLTAGFFCSISYKMNGDAKAQLDAYALRDEQEKCFEIMKDELGFNLQRTSREDTRTGRLFIMFVALILRTRIRMVWKDKLKGDKQLGIESSAAILPEMTPIRCDRYPDGKFSVTGFTGTQAAIATAFGLKIPECALSANQKAMLERKAAGRKPGRPRKSGAEPAN